jgi:hypothetical protein
LAPAIAHFDKGAYFREYAGNPLKGILFFFFEGAGRSPWATAIVLGEKSVERGVSLCGNIQERSWNISSTALKLTFKLDEDGRIKEARFKTFGCASAIAAASALTEMIKGMTVAEAEKVTNQDIADYLGGLPKEKMHCSVMGREALEKAIAHYKGVPGAEVEGKIICECFGVTEPEIERVGRVSRGHPRNH